MTPQSHLMVVAPIAADRESSLRLLLNSMNAQPGMADPANPVLPFGQFGQLHFARFMVLDDALQADLKEAYGVMPRRLPTVLAFQADFDGPLDALLADLAQRAGEGLRQVFSHCQGFDSRADLVAWMKANAKSSSASYVNWVGRTVVQIRQESALQRALARRVPREPVTSATQAHRLRGDLRAFVAGEIAVGRLALTPPAPTPLPWLARKIAHLAAVPLAGLLLAPLLLVAVPFIAWQLRRLESTDPELCPRPEPDDLHCLQELEDRDVTNQYTAIGAVKPGRFRRWLVSALLMLIGYGCRHVFTKGFLARVQTIHFAHWVVVDGGDRVIFTSNYDGSHQAYMDDFINKVAWGLNLVFSNGVGWPRTRWLIFGGSRIEQKFKYYQRRHQVPTQVWYKAYPGLTLVEMKRNHRIREGLESSRMSDNDVLEWLRLL